MPSPDSIVFVVDDDISVRESLELLISSAGIRAETFATARSFLERARVAVPSCLILDISLPGLNGLELQKVISTDRPELPIIFVTGHGDVPRTVQAMKAGAIEFLTKPFSDVALLNAVQQALERSRISLDHRTEFLELQRRYESLTMRERQVMSLVAAGLLNKQVGSELGISEITVKAHRGQVMQKMKASSLAELVRIASRLSVTAVPKS